MAWLIMSLTKSKLQKSISEKTSEKLKIQNELRRLSSFSTAIGDGMVTPAEIASLGTDLFGNALDVMAYANDVCTQTSQDLTDTYAQAYQDVTQEQYYNNSALAQQAQLYFDPDTGELDTDTMRQKFYESNMTEFIDKEIMPIINEKEVELQNKEAELEALVESEQAELDAVSDQISQEIQRNTIKLA